MNIGLEDKKIQKIVSLFSKYEAVEKAVIFGSRARGDFAYNSDIDIAVYTNGQSVTGLQTDLEEAAGIYKINLIVMDELNNDQLRQNIERDGVEVYRA
ncbi:nucleotidyltransferase family protein [Natranaerobius thermophilus]|uniref:DNA polymerase beta domain protein region n=1 Tax=Natranaerobius thermophilus (strain ATCC BAA-1301 / DSM 18059 / JW/NM-WN-LF) TaxID=457570 RepID=B2A1T4_NATTJ|nr:nucleotidyltransferase domain-containing protein [Natranaerobius thermophilus]ACB86131.1 DNA polymerase beta domain protein region [Natranaerobius thermophilus JW/NM-WN-LF]